MVTGKSGVASCNSYWTKMTYCASQLFNSPFAFRGLKLSARKTTVQLQCIFSLDQTVFFCESMHKKVILWKFGMVHMVLFTLLSWLVRTRLVQGVFTTHLLWFASNVGILSPLSCLQASKSKSGNHLIVCFEKALYICRIHCLPSTLASCIGKMSSYTERVSNDQVLAASTRTAFAQSIVGMSFKASS